MVRPTERRERGCAAARAARALHLRRWVPSALDAQKEKLMSTNLIANRGVWMIAALALAGGCVDGDEPIDRGEPSGAAHARQLEQAAGLDEAEILEMLEEHAGRPGEPVVLSGDAAVAFQGAQAELAAAAGNVRILCSAYNLPLPVPWVGHTKMTSCVHSDYWTSMNLESPAILSNLYDLASVTAIDTDLDLAGFPRIVAVPAAKAMSLVYRADWMQIFTHHYRGSASVRPRGSQTFLWPLLSPTQGW